MKQFHVNIKVDATVTLRAEDKYDATRKIVEMIDKHGSRAFYFDIEVIELK